MKRYLPLIVGAVLLVGGCGKKDDAQPAIKPEDSRASVIPTPPLPASETPKGAEAPSPQPGQAGDHSSPAFKAGGAPDKKK